MAEEKIIGFIINVQKFQEKDQIIKLLTSNEIIPIIALGTQNILSKNRVSLQLGNLVELEIFRARLNTSISKLKRAETIKRPNLDKNSSKILITEMMDVLNKLDKSNRDLFSLLNVAIDNFGTPTQNNMNTIVHNYALELMGYKQVATQCVKCGSVREIADYDFSNGGLLCKNHKRENLPLSILKSFINLNTDHDLYLFTSSRDNMFIYERLKIFLNEISY